MNALVLALFFMIATAVDGAGQYNVNQRLEKTSRFLTDESSNTNAAAKTGLIEENIFSSTVAVDILPSKLNNEDQSLILKLTTEAVHAVDAANNTELPKRTKSMEQRAWNLLNEMKDLAIKTNNTLLLSLVDKVVKKNDLKLFFKIQKLIKTSINDILLYTIKKMENITENSSGNNNREDQNTKRPAEFMFQKLNVKGIMPNNLSTVKDNVNIDMPRGPFQAKNNSGIADKFTNNKNYLDNYDGKMKTYYLPKKLFHLKENDVHLTNETLKFNEKHFVNTLSTIKIRDIRKFAEILISKSGLKHQYLGENKHSTHYFLGRRDNTNTSFDEFRINNWTPVNFGGRNIKKRELKRHSRRSENRRNRRIQKKLARKRRQSLFQLISDRVATTMAGAVKGFVTHTAPKAAGKMYSRLVKQRKLGDLGFFSVVYTIIAMITGIITGIVVVNLSFVLLIAAKAFDSFARDHITADVLIKMYKRALRFFDEHVGIVFMITSIEDTIKGML